MQPSPDTIAVPPAPSRPSPALWIKPGIFLLLCGAVALGGMVAWNNGIRDFFYPRGFRVVEPGEVFASAQIHRRLIRGVIAEHHLQRIVSLTDDGPGEANEEAEKKAAADLRVEWFCFPLAGDGTGDVRQYERAILQVARARVNHAPILVHCHSGTQRTRGWIAYWRLLVEGRSVADVKAELTGGGWQEPANPRLYPYLDDHMAEMATFLLTQHLVDRVPSPLPRLEP